MTRGVSRMREISIAKSKDTSAFSCPPEIGAAERVMGGGCERDVAFAGEQAGRRIETDPAGARQVDFGPGVEVREVFFRTRRPVERFHVRLELDQVARNKSRREAKLAQNLDQQPGRVATRPPAFLQGLTPASEHQAPSGSRSQSPVRDGGSSSTTKSIVFWSAASVDAGNIFIDQRIRSAQHEIGRQFLTLQFRILERPRPGRRPRERSRTG